jgi:hypothetical protein
MGFGGIEQVGCFSDDPSPRTLEIKNMEQTAENQYTNGNHSNDQHSNGEKHHVAPQIPSQAGLTFV